MYRRIIFPAYKLELESYVNLIYIDKTSSQFDKRLVEVIQILRKYSKNIKSIGYFKSKFIKVYLKVDTSAAEEIDALQFSS